MTHFLLFDGANILCLCVCVSTLLQKFLATRLTHAQITNLNIDRKTAATLIRLRTKHHKNMKISVDGTKKYQNCLGEELTPLHAFNCPAVVADLHLLNYPTEDDLYSHNAISKALQAHHDI
ncbi:unnamed protein product [Larinioides sclopetarius]|uniref:Uncharacterized protein n=1 Tax=Larinioides sclopetarius TaxID=280406 RepID=A0AAV2ADD9_9ARAC